MTNDLRYWWHRLTQKGQTNVFTCSTCRKHFSVLSKLMTYHLVTRLTRRVPLVEQELPTLPEHLSSPPVLSRVRVSRSLVLYVCFVDRCLSFRTFSFGHCVVCSSSIYGFWLPPFGIFKLFLYLLIKYLQKKSEIELFCLLNWMTLY